MREEYISMIKHLLTELKNSKLSSFGTAGVKAYSVPLQYLSWYSVEIQIYVHNQVDQISWPFHGLTINCLIKS